MENLSKCPKCGSTDVFTHKSKTGFTCRACKFNVKLDTEKGFELWVKMMQKKQRAKDQNKGD